MITQLDFPAVSLPIKSTIMKTIILVVLALALQNSVSAQINIGRKIKDKVNQRIDQKTDKAIDNGLDSIENSTKKTKTKTETEDGVTKTKTKTETEDGTKTKTKTESDNNNSSPAAASLASYSKFDFVPGEQVTFFDDFSNGAIGDFPVNWNTNGSGEMVTISNMPGRWLKWSAGVSYSPNLSNLPFPDNFTLEFDMLMQKPEGKEDPYFGLIIYSSDKDNVNEDFTAGTSLTTQSAWEC